MIVSLILPSNHEMFLYIVFDRVLIVQLFYGVKSFIVDGY